MFESTEKKKNNQAKWVNYVELTQDWKELMEYELCAKDKEKKTRRRIRIYISLVVMQYKQKAYGLKVLWHTNQTKLTNDQNG